MFYLMEYRSINTGKKEIHVVSFNCVSFSVTVLVSHKSDKSHFYTPIPEITDTKETQNASF